MQRIGRDDPYENQTMDSLLLKEFSSPQSFFGSQFEKKEKMILNSPGETDVDCNSIGTRQNYLQQPNFLFTDPIKTLKYEDKHQPELMASVKETDSIKNDWSREENDGENKCVKLDK